MTSMRFSEEEIELLDAMRVILERKMGVRLSRADTIRNLLLKVKPSSEPGVENHRHRDAYQKVFGS